MTHRSIAATLVLLSATMVAVTAVDDVATAIVYGALFGAVAAANMTFFGYMWVRYFGRRHLGSISQPGRYSGEQATKRPPPTSANLKGGFLVRHKNGVLI